MVDKADELEGEELVAKIGFLVITNSIREGIGAALADLKRFDETPLGQRIRSEYSIASIVDACDDRDIFFKVLTDLASMKDTIDIKYFVAFLSYGEILVIKPFYGPSVHIFIYDDYQFFLFLAYMGGLRDLAYAIWPT